MNKYYSRNMYALCYSFPTSHIIGMEIWLQVEVNELHLTNIQKET